MANKIISDMMMIPIDVKELPIVTDVGQSKNALYDFTDEGIADIGTDVEANAKRPIEVTLVGIVILESAVHWRNAASPYDSSYVIYYDVKMLLWW